MKLLSPFENALLALPVRTDLIFVNSPETIPLMEDTLWEDSLDTPAVTGSAEVAFVRTRSLALERIVMSLFALRFAAPSTMASTLWSTTETAKNPP